ncbi:hypothetical protein DYB28_004377 [Aphanomyces astaci]|uniref:Uncharacterized protein n=1 Tax=Aphanomyces astaci TaxID=112090 RepID=A0A9X8DXR8_APHAT|nr:hypothetical protein DYB28_004377 [Aphanomyces astaci]
MLDTASAAAVQQKNLRIIETFIASENSRELQLAQCKSVEKRGLLEMEFALARAHESKLLHRMMRKGDDSDRLEDEVHAMVVASSKRMHDIEAIMKEVVLDVEGFEVRVRKKQSVTPVRPFTADATATPGVRGVRALKVQHARDVVVHGDYERARTEDTATVQVPLDMGCQDAFQVPDDTGVHVTLEVPVAANERHVRADKEGLDEARPVHTEFQEVLQIPVSTEALQVHTGFQNAPQVPADTRLQVAALQGRQNLQLNPPTPDSSTLSSFSEDGSSSAIPSAALENLQLNPPTPDSSTLSSFSEDGSSSAIPSATLDPPDQNDTLTLTVVDVALQVPAIETSSPGATTSTSQNVSPPMLLLQVHEVSESAVHSIVTNALHSLQSHSSETTYDDDDTSYDVTPTLISPDKDRSSHLTTFAAAPTTQDLLAVAESFLPTAAEAPHDAQLEISSSSTSSSTKDAAIQVQRMVRGHHGRKQFQATLYREAQTCGVLGAMPGTTQGATGWYQEQTTFTAHYFVVLPSGEWRPKVQVKCPHMILTPYDMARHVHSVINVVDNID